MGSFTSLLPLLPGWERSVLRNADRLVALSHREEADEMLSRCIATAPGSLPLALRHAFCAHDAGLYAEAAGRWDRVRSRWPDVPIAWCGSASNRRELNSVHEAREIIDEALRLFPEDRIAISEALRIYQVLRDGEGLLRLSASMMRLDPGCDQWRLDHFDRLLEANREGEAAELLPPRQDRRAVEAAWTMRGVRLAIRRREALAAEDMLQWLASPTRLDVPLATAVRTFAMGLDVRYPGEALVFWTHLKRIDPEDGGVLHHHAECLIRCGRYDEAGREIALGLAKHPGSGDLARDRALLAMRRERFDEAVADLRRLLALEPGDTHLGELLSQARFGQAQASLEAGDAAAAGMAAFAGGRQDVGLVEDEPVRRLLMGFESLGQDCEFGLVQRRYGAEPLGLFRWNFCETEMLRRAAETAFDGIGDPEHTVLSLWDDHEWYVRDARYGFSLHTRINRHEADRDELHARMCKRIGFMRRKLLSDLASGEKILIHKTFASGSEEVRVLYASLRRLGPVRLLWVRSEHSGGGAKRDDTVEEIEPGLYAGCIRRFGNRLDGPWNIAFEDWVALCASLEQMGVPREAGGRDAAVSGATEKLGHASRSQ